MRILSDRNDQIRSIQAKYDLRVSILYSATDQEPHFLIISQLEKLSKHYLGCSTLLFKHSAVSKGSLSLNVKGLTHVSSFWSISRGVDKRK